MADPPHPCLVVSLHHQTTALWAKGTRLRLHVASAGFIRWERNLMAYGYESLIPITLEVEHAGVATVGGDGSASPLTPDGQAEVQGKSYLYLPIVDAKSVKTGRSVRV
jgi:predicted acyl esterase